MYFSWWTNNISSTSQPTTIKVEDDAMQIDQSNINIEPIQIANHYSPANNLIWEL